MRIKRQLFDLPGSFQRPFVVPTMNNSVASGDLQPRLRNGNGHQSGLSDEIQWGPESDSNRQGPGPALPLEYGRWI